MVLIIILSRLCLKIVVGFKAFKKGMIGESKSRFSLFLFFFISLLVGCEKSISVFI